MGLFNKNKKEENGDIPKLPELPRLPDLPELDNLKNLPQLPNFPRSSIGEKFSQYTIKDAISGSKEYNENLENNEFESDEEEMQGIQKPGEERFIRDNIGNKNTDDEYKQFQRFERKALETPSFSESGASYRKTEPIFIRLDKFEESLKIFEKTRSQISEIENVLREINKIKEQEEKELQFWEQEIQNIKKQIEKVDKDIFSRV